jgi:hypothetical protein
MKWFNRIFFSAIIIACIFLSSCSGSSRKLDEPVFLSLPEFQPGTAAQAIDAITPSESAHYFSLFGN